MEQSDTKTRDEANAHLTDEQWGSVFGGIEPDDATKDHLCTCNACKQLSTLFSPKEFVAMLESVSGDAAEERGRIADELRPSATELEAHRNASNSRLLGWPLAVAAGLVGLLLGFLLNPGDSQKSSVATATPAAFQTQRADRSRDPVANGDLGDHAESHTAQRTHRWSFEVPTKDGMQRAKVVLSEQGLLDLLARGKSPGGYELVGRPRKQAEPSPEHDVALKVGRVVLEHPQETATAAAAEGPR